MGSETADGAADPGAPLARSLSGAAAREARKQRLEEQGKAAREARKQRQEEKEKQEKDAEALRLRKIALARERRLAGGTLTEEVAEDQQAEAADAAEEEARRLRLAEKIATRRAAQEKERAEAEAAEAEAAKAAGAAVAAEGAAEGARAEKQKSEETASSAHDESSNDSASPAETKNGKQGGKSKTEKSQSSSESTKITRKRKQVTNKVKKKSKKKKKKKKKGSSTSSSSSGRSPSPAAVAMAKAMAIAEKGCFPWERLPATVPAQQNSLEVAATLAAPSATREEVEDFINLSGGVGRGRIELEAAQRLQGLTPQLQRLVLDRGPIGNSRNPTSVLLARLNQAEQGLLGKPGEAGPPKNKDIERLITKHNIDGSAACRLRHMSLAHQRAALAIAKECDLSKATNPSGLLMAKMNEHGLNS